LNAVVAALGVERVPHLGTVDASRLPRTVDDAAAWLATTANRSRAGLHGDERHVAPEGIVLRGLDARWARVLAKARFEDYRRTTRVREEVARVEQ